MNSKLRILSASLSLAALAISAHAGGTFTEVDLTGQANNDIQTYSGGANYQLGGTQLDVNGVSFALGQFDTEGNPTGTGTTGVLQTSPETTSFTLNLAPGTQGTAVFTLINSAFGAFGADEGSVVVTGAGGETATLDLVEGTNIRDHFNDGFINTLSDPSIISTYFSNGAPSDGSTDRLDMQEIDLPSSFIGDDITSITFSDDNSSTGTGEPFLAGLSIENSSSVPDDFSTVALCLAGMFFLAVAGRSRFRPLSLK